MAGRPKYDLPEATSRSSGTIAAAVTVTSVCPGRRAGSGWSRTTGASPGVSSTAARSDPSALGRVDVDGVAVDGQVGLHADRPAALLGDLPEQAGRPGQQREPAQQLDRQAEVGQRRAADARRR